MTQFSVQRDRRTNKAKPEHTSTLCRRWDIYVDEGGYSRSLEKCDVILCIK